MMPEESRNTSLRADYWKSQPKKFCQYCKCWIADNKPSVEFHERGKNHKENVAAKISEIKKKSMDKAKQDEKNCKEFAAMEAAAMKAYEEDLKRMGVESGTTEVPTTSPPSAPPPQPPSQPKSQPQPQRREKKGKRSQRDGQHSVESRTQTQVWVPGKSEEGHTYYYNTLTGESKWENPEGFQGESSDPSQTGQSENSTGGGWKEAVSPEGHTYYYHTETGASSWERPADFSSADASEPGPPGESQSQPEAPGTSSPAPAPQEPEGNGQDSQQPKGPKISFRKRKAGTESTDKEEEESASGNEKEDDVGEKEQEEASNQAAPVPEKEEEMKAKEKEEEVVKTEEEEGAHITKEEVVERKAQHAKKQRKTTPYGAWEQIQEEEDPYDTVDLQLPHMEGMAAGGLDDLPPPEPKPKFRERTVTSLGDQGGGGGPASFKKSRALNGRARSIRQRVEDD